MNACALNQFHGHWLLFDALNATIILNLKLKEFGISFSLEDSINDDSIVALELSLLAFNMWGFKWFSFILKHEKNKAHNMLSLILDPIFKSLRLVSFVISQEHVSIVEEYDK